MTQYELPYGMTPDVAFSYQEVASNQLFRTSMWKDLTLFFEQLVFNFFGVLVYLKAIEQILTFIIVNLIPTITCYFSVKNLRNHIFKLHVHFPNTYKQMIFTIL